MLGSPAGTRRLGAADLPIRIGTGSGADIRVPGPVTGEIIGFISSLDDRPFLQAAGGDGLAVNAVPVPATRWLEDGDVISVGALRVECHFDAAALRFSIAYTDTEYATLPPVDAGPGPGAPKPAIAPRRARAAAEPQVRRRHWWLYGGLAVLAVVALFLFTARAVGISVTPGAARVTLRGAWLPLKFGSRYLLRPGRYEVALEAEGYAAKTASIDVGTASSQEFHFDLAPLPGRLVLAGAPPVGLEVAIDGQPVRPLPGGEYPAPAGTRHLRVTAPRYQALETTVEVAGRDQRQTVNVTLAPDWADVSVRSVPPGAHIRVGDADLGVTPATVPVPSGTATLELRLDGYKPWRQALSVTAGEALTLPEVRLQESDGLLAVVSTPAGATVSVDARYRGVTPLEIDIAPGRTHEVIIARPGFETASRSVRVERRGSASLRVQLAERLGVVRVEPDPPDAELYVNGERRGVGSQELTLRAVPQRIEVRKAGYASFATEVTPRPGMPQLVQAKLLTPEQAVLAATPATVTTKQGQVLRRVGPGEFETGTPRREQGRRPNETQRLVRITHAYYIGVREVTNREFREFRPNHTSGAEKYKQLAGSDHPVVMLSWEDAVAYCNWLSDRDGLPPAYVQRAGTLRLAEPATVGYRLPTEAEWEWASRYNGGGGARRYPWGDHMPPADKSGNFADQSAKGIVANVLAGYNDGYPVTAPVASFTPSPLGLYDIGGNAAEWVNDLYTVYSGDAGGPATDPLGPDTGQYHVIRGSSWRQSSITDLRLAYRDFGDQGRLDVGFRLARYASAP